MTKRRKFLIVGGSVLALAAGGAGVALATGGGEDESEAPIPSKALDQASAAAIAETGGGKVTETEVGDEESYYEVEVTRDDGSQVDVQLDREFNGVGSSSDGNEDDGSGDDQSEGEK
jgi:hypothetical protein